MQDILDIATPEPAPRELNVIGVIALNGACALGMIVALKALGTDWGVALLVSWLASGALALALGAALVRILPVISARRPRARPGEAAMQRRRTLEAWQDDLCIERMDSARRRREMAGTDRIPAHAAGGIPAHAAGGIPAHAAAGHAPNGARGGAA